MVHLSIAIHAIGFTYAVVAIPFVVMHRGEPR
jgi:hypothetical protein